MKKYSASTNAFYDPEIKQIFPDDVLEITDKEWFEMLCGQSQGKVIVAGSDGRPFLTERVYSEEEIISQAGYRKAELRSVADEVIAPLQDAVDLDIATEDEAAALTAWKNYRVLLNRIDTSTAPDISWPTKPE